MLKENQQMGKTKNKKSKETIRNGKSLWKCKEAQKGKMVWTFFVCGKEFEKEKDSNRIYAYSSCIIALVGCIISVVAFIKTGAW